jgi:hypothetical protein
VPVDEPYQHICGQEVIGRLTGRAFRASGVWEDRDGQVRGDCAACAAKWIPRRRPRTTTPTVPAVDAQALAAGEDPED